MIARSFKIAYGGSILAVRSGLKSSINLDKDISFHRITIVDYLASAAIVGNIC